MDNGTSLSERGVTSLITGTHSLRTSQDHANIPEPGNSIWTERMKGNGRLLSLKRKKKKVLYVFTGSTQQFNFSFDISISP